MEKLSALKGKSDAENTEQVLPKEKLDKHKAYQFWKEYLENIKTINRPAYNVLETVDWEIDKDENIVLKFESEAMSIEFENLRDDFTIRLRESLNNYYIQIIKIIKETPTKKKHIKSRRDIFEELAEKNPNLIMLQKIMDLDIDNEPPRK